MTLPNSPRSKAPDMWEQAVRSSSARCPPLPIATVHRAPPSCIRWSSSGARDAQSHVRTEPSHHSKSHARLRAPSALLVAALALLLLGCGSVVLAHAPNRSSDTHELAKSAAQPTVLSIAPRRADGKFAAGAVGLSVEADELGTHDLSATHKSLVGLMRLLGTGVLRLGGSSLDYSWWSSDGEPPPAWAKSAITPSDLVGLRNLLVATDWKAILGVDLGHFDPARAANEARAAEQILGPRLLGIEVGNEPNDYRANGLRSSSYSPSEYLENLAAYTTAIRSAAPQVSLYGPDLPAQAWLPAVTSDKSIPFAAITEHYYPTFYNFANGNCKATPVPTALELLSSAVRERENTILRVLVADGDLTHHETRISETNSTGSCDADGGPSTSPTFASALWSLDWTLRAASAGVTGLNFHGYFGHCGPNTVSPICAPSEVAEVRGDVIARPVFYGLVAARQLEGGHFILVRYRGGSATAHFSTYATIHPGGRVTVAIDNFAVGKSSSFLLKVPGYLRGTIERLTAPSLDAITGVTFGTASFDDGRSPRTTATRVPKVGDAFQIALAPTSAAIITLYR
jgi:hypothetical protein